MRSAAAGLVASLLWIAPAAGQQSAGLEQNQARPGGVFLTVAAGTPSMCARACENDNLCMSWTLSPLPGNSCELKAVIPPAQSSPGSFSGLSSRAPRLMRLIPPANTAVAAPRPTPIAAETIVRTEPRATPREAQRNAGMMDTLGTGESTVSTEDLLAVGEDVAPIATRAPGPEAVPAHDPELHRLYVAPAPPTAPTPPAADKPRAAPLRMGR